MANLSYQGGTTAAKHETEAQRRLTAELRNYFINYFMRKYPTTKKITLRHYYDRYTARVKYVGENPNRTFFVCASTYEALVLKVQENYASRGVQMVAI